MFDELFELLEYSDHCVAFTGAGVSTMSGIPDFRGKNGIFNETFQGVPIEQIHDADYFKAHPEVFYAYRKRFVEPMLAAEPNIIHRVLTQLESKKMVNTIYTQNIDGLHQKAGSLNVHEFHGTLSSNSCMSCHRKISNNELGRYFNSSGVPYCECGGLIKPDVVFFGDEMDVDLLDQAFGELENTDLLLVLGTSLMVPPVASLPMATYHSGGKIVIINNQSTPLDVYSYLLISDLKITFSEIEKWLAQD